MIIKLANAKMHKRINKKNLTEKKIVAVLGILILAYLIPIIIKGQAADILPYFLNTSGNDMSSGEYFRVEDLGGSRFRICKSRDCVGYQLYRYDGSYIYFIEDTTWATGLNQPISCLDTGNYAFYRVYNGYGANCSNLGDYSLGGPWAPRAMSVGQTFTSEHSIVAFDTTTDQCCDGQYAGDFGYRVTLTYEGCIDFPTGVTSPHGIVLSTGSENFYFDANRGWVGWDQGTSGSGSYTTNDLGAVDGSENCLNVGSALIFGPGNQRFIVTMEWPPDPATFYIVEEDNVDLIEAVRSAVATTPGFNPPPGWEPSPMPVPPPSNPSAILNIPDLRQTDGRWADINLGISCNPQENMPMRTHGCGPTSIAMIISYLYPLQQISPGTIGENIDTSTGVVCGRVGTAYMPIVNWLINERIYTDLHYADITVNGAFNVDAIAQSISIGRPVVTYCSNWGSLDWNHISVIKGVDSGFIYFQDPILGEAAYTEDRVINDFGCVSATSFWR